MKKKHDIIFAKVYESGQKKNTRIWLNTNYNEEEIKVNHLEK